MCYSSDGLQYEAALALQPRSTGSEGAVSRLETSCCGCCRLYGLCLRHTVPCPTTRVVSRTHALGDLLGYPSFSAAVVGIIAVGFNSLGEP